jgi:hypothetical protein
MANPNHGTTSPMKVSFKDCTCLEERLYCGMRLQQQGIDSALLSSSRHLRREREEGESLYNMIARPVLYPLLPRHTILCLCVFLWVLPGLGYCDGAAPPTETKFLARFRSWSVGHSCHCDITWTD